MARPLIISDCDEVLMHMVVPFGEWLDADHGVLFRMEDASFRGALRRKACGTVLEPAEVWPLLEEFFAGHMHRQSPIAGAQAALQRLSAQADIVILTNVGPDHAAARTEQLHTAGMPYRVIGNRGSKGEPVARLLDELRPSSAAFIDDLSQHHALVAEAAPHVWRLHMVGEPVIAGKISPAEHAHARIDSWAEAEHWLTQKLAAGFAPA